MEDTTTNSDGNQSSNNQLYNEGQQLKDKVDSWHLKVEDKIQVLKTKQDDMNAYKQSIMDKIDKFMDLIIEKVNQRREFLKQEFKTIEAREKRRIKSKQMKLERDLSEIKNFSSEFQDFLNEFDSDMDYLANKASYDGYVGDLQQLEQEAKKSQMFFKTSEYRDPTFSYLQSEIELIEQLGKISDNSDFSMPLVTFNSEKLQCFGYNEKLRDFVELKLQDEDNYAQVEVPRFFKSMYMPDDKFILVGGLERTTSHSSSRTFLIDDKGRLSPLSDMSIGRQYFALCADYLNEFAYAISGYNHEKGLLKTVEKFSFKARKWLSVEPINHGRINAAACRCGTKYLYVFGGLDNKDFLDSIERFNLTLDVWTVLKIKLPQRMSNLYSYSLNSDHIVILGGMKKKQEEFIPSESSKKYELENRVFVLKTSNFKWKDLKPFPFKKKFGNIVYNGYGKFFCFVIENNMQLPQLLVYDVRNSFPQFDKYWENDKQQKEGLQKIKGKDIRVYLANMKQNQTNKYYQINHASTQVMITESQSLSQTYSYNGTAAQPSPFAKGRSIEMNALKQNSIEK